MSEIQVRAEGARAHDAVEVAAPERLVVELHVVALHAAENRGTKLAVADGQRRGHPDGSRRVVPQCMLVRRLPRGRARDAHFFHVGGLHVGKFHVVFSHELQRVVRVALVPATEFLINSETAPLVQVGPACAELIDVDFVAIKFAVGRFHDLKRPIARRGRCCRLEAVATDVVEHQPAFRRELVAVARGCHLPELRLLLAFRSHGGFQILTLALRCQHGLAALHLDEIPKFFRVGAHFGEHHVCQGCRRGQQAENRCHYFLHNPEN